MIVQIEFPVAKPVYALFCCLEKLARKMGYFFASNEWLSKIFRKSLTWVEKSLKVLESLGFIKRECLKFKFGSQRKIYILKKPKAEFKREPEKVRVASPMKSTGAIYNYYVVREQEPAVSGFQPDDQIKEALKKSLPGCWTEAMEFWRGLRQDYKATVRNVCGFLRKAITERWKHNALSQEQKIEDLTLQTQELEKNLETNIPRLKEKIDSFNASFPQTHRLVLEGHDLMHKKLKNDFGWEQIDWVEKVANVADEWESIELSIEFLFERCNCTEIKSAV